MVRKLPVYVWICITVVTLARNSYGCGGIPVARMKLSACHENVGGTDKWYEAVDAPIYMLASWYFSQWGNNSEYSYDTDFSQHYRLPVSPNVYGIKIWQWDFDGNGTFDYSENILSSGPPGDSPPDVDFVNGATIHTYNTPGQYNLKLKVWDDDAYEGLGPDKSSERTYPLAIVHVGLSAPTCVAVNWDDDDEDGKTDSHDGFNEDGITGNEDDANPQEDELVPVTISFAPAGLPGKVAFGVGGTCFWMVKVWSGPPPQKGNLIMPTNDPYYSYYVEIPTTDLPKTYYIEGIWPSSLNGVDLCAYYISPGGNCNVGYQYNPITVMEVDMDMDGLTDYEYDYPGVTEEMKPGGFVPLNDLAKITLQPIRPTELPVNLFNPVIFDVPVGGSKVRIWENEDKTGEVSLPKYYYFPMDLPDTLWVEGIETSSAPRDIQLLMQYGSFEDRIKLTVYSLEKVEFETYMDNDGPDNHPSSPPNGGKRIFPDKKACDDPYPDRRKIVTVKATITPAIDNRHVYFKDFDVDDPSSDIAPIDENGSVGGDNYGGAGSLSTNDAVTNGSGEARVRFAVTMNPGDNFRIAAALSEDKLALTATTQQMADADAPPPGVKFTPMLTVWRKLHLELDSMTAGLDNPVSNRNIDDTWNNTPHTGESGAEINGWNIHPDEGQYEGGTLTVSGINFEIIDNIDDWGDDTVYVIGNICPYEDNLASFTDDDICPLPRKVDWGLMNSKFNPAYVEVVEEPGVYNSNATFIANLTDLSVTEAVRSRTTASDYWMAQVMSCHQGEISTDGDADGVYHWHGFTSYKTGDVGVKVGESSPTGDNICVIYLESIRDQAAQEPFLVSIGWRSTAYSNSDIERTTVVHEIGHVFGCVHSDGEIMQGGPENPALDFSDVSINRIRNNNP